MSKDVNTKIENLRKMIADLDAKIEKLTTQKHLYELSLQSLEKQK